MMWASQTLSSWSTTWVFSLPTCVTHRPLPCVCLQIAYISKACRISLQFLFSALSSTGRRSPKFRLSPLHCSPLCRPCGASLVDFPSNKNYSNRLYPWGCTTTPQLRDRPDEQRRVVFTARRLANLPNVCAF
ncbi:hypothetical protein B0H12DRAFT_747308 [Mycena haematopus]|nr:hypothetical protein B0H12DRAFT_747308 [Mycena haematopus]